MNTGDIMGGIKEIKSISVLSFALIVALVLAVTMFIFGIVMSIFSGSMFSIPFNAMPMMNYAYSGMSAVYFILMMPIMMFIYSFLIAALAAVIYNLIAPLIGGIKLELE